MKICFPVAENQGLGSAVYGHFGSARAQIDVSQHLFCRQLTGTVPIDALSEIRKWHGSEKRRL